MSRRNLALVCLAMACTGAVDAASLASPSSMPKAANALVLRGGAIGLSSVAASANLAIWGMYGLVLVTNPNWLMQNVMMSPTTLSIDDVGHTLAQYLGAVYISQALRMLRALTHPEMAKSDLMGAALINSLLCATSLFRFLRGAALNEVTMTLPLGQATMATLSYLGALRAS
jgi:drug/metabolite transporter superfamily protein YnfA